MAESTEETIREALVAAIRGISAELGFDEVGGNVRDYPFDLFPEEDRTDFLVAQVGNEPLVRCWTVFVTGSDRWHVTGGQMLRTYRVRFEAFYEVGSPLEVEQMKAGVNLLVDHARKVRGAIRQLGSRLGQRVDTMGPISEVEISKLSGVEPSDGQILVGTFGFTADRGNPDF